MSLPDAGRHPTLLNSCASAATAAEARFRIEPHDVSPRASRVIALDEQAAAVVRRLAGRRWDGAHFLAFEALVPDGPGGDPDEVVLRSPDGSVVLLSDELSAADVVVMIATARARADAASAIGDACAERGIMSAGLVLPGTGMAGSRTAEPGSADTAVSALRPNAMVLVILNDETDVPEILTALRA